MIIFIEDDEEYLHWIDQHANGYVVNANRHPVPTYLVLHHSTCPHISTDARTHWTTGQYIKICAESLEQLQSWASREVSGELKLCGLCCSKPKLREVEVSVPGIIAPIPTKPASKEWTIWRPKTELQMLANVRPLKASWDKSTDASQVRLREYRQSIREELAPHLYQDCLYLDLRVALPQSASLLDGNDLENYLTPLFECGCLPAAQFRLVMAEKASGGTSSLALGVAQPTGLTEQMHICCHFVVCPTTKPSNDSAWKEELCSRITSSGIQQLPDGEVELHIAWKSAIGRRSWFRMWKSTGDALGPILGQYERKNRYDPKDDRITKLVLYLLPDESMGDCIEIGLWWKIRESIAASA